VAPTARISPSTVRGRIAQRGSSVLPNFPERKSLEHIAGENRSSEVKGLDAVFSAIRHSLRIRLDDNVFVPGVFPLLR
jgi:hypothetical protein